MSENESVKPNEIEMKRETVTIVGDRPLYNYTFTLDGEPLPPMRPEDVVPMPAKPQE